MNTKYRLNKPRPTQRQQLQSAIALCLDRACWLLERTAHEDYAETAECLLQAQQALKDGPLGPSPADLPTNFNLSSPCTEH